MRIVVTGASGFIGGHVVRHLESAGHAVTRAVRSPSGVAGGREVVLGDLAEATDLGQVVADQDVVIHLAARVHVMDETSKDPLAAFRAVNVDGTVALARAAEAAGVRRFVFLSSIKVNGERTSPDPEDVFDVTSEPLPQDAYGVSKLEAEQALLSIAASSAMAVTLVRTPLVIGPGVGGNVRRLLRLADSGIPLPFGAVRNARSLMSVSALASILEHASLSSSPGGTLILVASPPDLTTTELFAALRTHLGRPRRLVPVPAGLLRALGAVTRRDAEIDRLVGSLRVRPGSDDPDWTWPDMMSLDDELRRTVDWYRGLRS